MFSYPFLTYSLGLTPTRGVFALKLNVTNARPFFAKLHSILQHALFHFCSLPFPLCKLSFPRAKLGWLGFPSSLHLHLKISALAACSLPASLLARRLITPLPCPSRTHTLASHGSWFLHTTCFDLSHLRPPSFQSKGLKNKVTNHFLDWRFMHWSLFSPGTFDSPLILSVAPPCAISE